MSKNPHAVALGRRGGKARIENLTKEERRELGRKAGIASGKVRKAKAKERKARAL
jgi:general stress protein YciG